jgi:hypothetical protein
VKRPSRATVELLAAAVLVTTYAAVLPPALAVVAYLLTVGVWWLSMRRGRRIAAVRLTAALAAAQRARAEELAALRLRPSQGWLRRADGTIEQVRYVQTDDPLVFLPVTPDGERFVIKFGDRFTVDRLVPGQSLLLTLEEPEPGQLPE